MKKIIALVLSVIMLACCLTSCGAKTRSLDDIKKSGKLVLYTEAGFAPFEFISGGKVVGVDIAICEEIAKEIGVELEVHDVNFDTIIGAIKSGKCDIGAAGMTITEERKEEVDFSIPYTTSKQYIVCFATDKDDMKLEDLAGKKIGVQLGTTSDFICSDEVSGTDDDDGNHTKGKLEGTGAEVVTYQNPNLAAVALKENKIDVVVTDKLPAEMIAANSDGVLKCYELIYADGSVTDESYGIAMAKGNKELLDLINDIVNKLIASGKIDEFIVHFSNEVTAD